MSLGFQRSALPLVLATALVATGGRVHAQATHDSVRVVLGPEFGPPGGPAARLGKGWRPLWTDSVTLTRLDATRMDVGVDGARIEEGELADVVRFRDASGRAWRMVPMLLDPVTPSLPPDLRYTPLAAFLRDLVVTVHPTAPLVVNSLYGAAGLTVLRSHPMVLPGAGQLPDDMTLLAGRAVWLEESPATMGGPWQGFSRVITTDSLLALQAREPTLRVRVEDYLAARLVDMVVGDRDRRPAHWLWGLRDGTWVPIGVRHEEAMLRASGLDKFILGATEPGYVVFGAEAPRVRQLTVRSYDLDRTLLSRLDRAGWDRVAATVRAALTDGAIAEAVEAMPPEHVRLAGAFVREALTVRRNALAGVTDDFFELVMQYPDLVLSDLAEEVGLKRSQAGDLRVVVAVAGASVLDRTFRSGETREVRLFLGGGDDVVRLGNLDAGGVGIRVSSGPGADRIEGTGADVSGVVLYDDPASTVMAPPGSVRMVPHQAGRLLLWPDSGPRPQHLDWGTRRSPVIDFDLNADLGLLVGGGMQWTQDGFDEPVYRERTRVSAAYATRPGSGRLVASYERRNVLRNMHVKLAGRASGIEVVRYFGLGNETGNDMDLDESFYRARTRELSFAVTAGLSRHPDREFNLGPAISFTSVDTTDTGRLVELQDPYGSGDFFIAGLIASYVHSRTRTDRVAGLHTSFEVTGEYFPGWGDLTEGAFGGVRGRVEVGLVPSASSRLVLAGRLGGAALVGGVPFTRAARIGGPPTLRGYETDRFAGDEGSLFGSLEARLRMFRFRIGFAPLDFGVFAFGDAGRVFTSGEHSSELHPTLGGGAWISPSLGWLPQIDALLGRVEVARSSERTVVSVGTGFRF